ncbi:MAG: hypothetical protein M1837_000653 [Sclerophora amabilis]|nr:MAG: hypothetical protein M1837_000653 [Sclerophora amabilis]
MTPRKSKTHARQQQLNHQPSDYESDVNASDVPPPPPPSRTNAELNLSVLRRHNPEVSSILALAPFAVIYSFSSSTQQWEKIGVEGTLFVCQLSSTDEEVERYTVTILNRRDLHNFEAELLNEADVEVTQGYVILKVNDEDQVPRVYGIWIFAESPTSSTANVPAITAQIIQDCAVQAETSRRLVEQRQAGRVQQPVGPANGGLASEPMGRQLSLRELFGHQRGQESELSTKAHSPPMPSTHFVPSADTDFFRSTVRPSQSQTQQQAKSQGPGPTQKGGANELKPDSLLELFRKAGEGLKKEQQS